MRVGYSLMGESSWHKKVIGSRSRSQEQTARHFLLPQFRNSIDINPVCMHAACGFRLWRIEWRDRILVRAVGRIVL